MLERRKTNSSCYAGIGDNTFREDAFHPDGTLDSVGTKAKPKQCQRVTFQVGALHKYAVWNRVEGLHNVEEPRCEFLAL